MTLSTLTQSTASAVRDMCRIGPAKLKELRNTFAKRSQAVFWGTIGVTQSGGSRYESGRNMPKPTALLLNLATLPDSEAQKLLAEIREAIR